MSTKHETSLEGNKKHNYDLQIIFLLLISLFGHAVLRLQNYPSGLGKAPDAAWFPPLAWHLGLRRMPSRGHSTCRASHELFDGSGQRHIIDWKSSHFLTIHKKDSLFFFPLTRQTTRVAAIDSHSTDLLLSLLLL